MEFLWTNMQEILSIHFWIFVLQLKEIYKKVVTCEGLPEELNNQLERHFERYVKLLSKLQVNNVMHCVGSICEDLWHLQIYRVFKK